MPSSSFLSVLPLSLPSSCQFPFFDFPLSGAQAAVILSWESHFLAIRKCSAARGGGGGLGDRAGEGGYQACQPLRSNTAVVVAEVIPGHETEPPGAPQEAFLTHGLF